MALFHIRISQGSLTGAFFYAGYRMTSITIERTDGLSSSTAYKGPARLAASVNVPLNGLPVIDGVQSVLRDRVLLTAQTDPRDNGLYVVDTGVWRRSADFNKSRDVVKGTRVWITDGASGRAEWEVSSENPISVGVDAITFTRFPSVFANSITEPTLATSLALSLANVVTTRTVLKALNTTRWNVAYLTEAGREGIFIWKTGDYSVHVALDTLEGRYVKATAIAATAGCWVRQDTGLDSVKWYGAVGNNVADDLPAFTAAFAVAKAYGRGLYIPTGIYNFDTGAATTTTWDWSGVQYGFTIQGDGLLKSEIRFNDVVTSGTIAWHWTSTGPHYDKVFKGWMVRCFHDGPALVLGKNDFSDSFETSYFERFSVINQYSGGGTASEALRLNFVLGCTFVNSRFGCYANGSGTNIGTAIRFRQACFNTFLNTDFGNARRGIDFTDMGSYGNEFTAGGSENCNWNVDFRTSLATENTWIGGRFSLWVTYAITSSGADTNDSNVFKNIKFNNGAGPATVLDPTGFTGVTIEDGIAVTTPTLAASTVAVTNTQGRAAEVRIWGGTVTVITINGFGLGLTSGTFTVNPADTIAITYSVAPTWSWFRIK